MGEGALTVLISALHTNTTLAFCSHDWLWSGNRKRMVIKSQETFFRKATKKFGGIVKLGTLGRLEYKTASKEPAAQAATKPVDEPSIDEKSV